MKGEAAAVVGALVGLGVSLGIVVAVLGSMVGFPLLYRKRFASWTAGKTPRQAYGELEQGASRSFFQLFPATYLFEEVIQSRLPMPQALEHVNALFASGWGRKVLGRDQEGVVFSYRMLPFLATDAGWIGVVLAEPQGYSTVLHLRMRTTYLLPVITFFLSLRIRLWLPRRLAG